MPAKAYDVIGIGSCSWDTTLVVSAFPSKGSKCESKVICHNGGGLMGTAIATLAQLGSTAAFLGRVGDDILSQALVDELRAFKVDVSLLLPKLGSSCRIAHIIVDENTAERTVFWSKNNAPILLDHEFNSDIFKESKWVFIDQHEPNAAKAALAEAVNHGIMVAVDADAAGDRLDYALPYANLIFSSADYALHFSKENNLCKAARRIALEYESIAVVTDGTNGSWICSADINFHQPAYNVSSVLDTTGAGDVYHGAFLYSIIESQSLFEAADFASAAAAYSCTRFGSRSGIPKHQDIITTRSSAKHEFK